MKASTVAVPAGAVRNRGAGPGIEEMPPRRLKREGFEEEAVPHMEAVYRFALRLAQGNTADAEDLTQETFLRAYRAWDTFQSGTNARSWLFTICRNAFLRRRERQARRPETMESQLEVELDSVASEGAFGEPPPDPERAFFESFIDEEVLRQVDLLPDEFREAVVLSDLQGLSYADIARTLEIPIGTVRSRLFRGRRLLQKALYDYAREAGYLGRD